MTSGGSAGDGGTTDRTPSDRVDVCVVGAGPAGSLVAHRLAAAGHEVVVLEAGERFDPADRRARMERAIRPAHDGGSVWGMGGERDRFTSAGERFYPLNSARVKGVGGSTLHWQGMVMRLHEKDFRLHSTWGVGVDWPVSYRDLQPYYARAERALGVAGADDNPFAPPRERPFPMPAFEPSHSDSLFAPACERLGIATHSVPNARNSEAYDDRPTCQGYGTCQPVCPSGAKYDATVHARKAEAAGARVIDRAPVQRLEHDRAGDRVEAAVYATPDGTQHRQEARAFVVACGGVESPRLLLLSRSEEHPDGLANSSGAVGRYFTEHLFAGVGGRLDRPTRQNQVGFNTTESHQFYDDPRAPFGPERGSADATGTGADGGDPADRPVPDEDPGLSSIKLEFLNYAGPSPVELALGADEWGDDLLESLREAYGSALAVGGLVGQLPRKDNRIELDPSTTDDHGNPVPEVHWRVGDRAARTVERANGIQRAVLEEMNAEVTWTVGPADTGPAFHHMGTTRMGADPATSVVNARCRTHDLANLWISGSSVFPTGGAMNPTLTIAALALRIADHVDEAL
ncbi:GMC family oxidoreductase [Halobacteriales archaeon QS_8_69_26]|nr:MAG: GMC family oxidoreductase [Halobacteriales archaeon QS_8_69_26]